MDDIDVDDDVVDGDDVADDDDDGDDVDDDDDKHSRVHCDVLMHEQNDQALVTYHKAYEGLVLQQEIDSEAFVKHLHDSCGEATAYASATDSATIAPQVQI